MKTGSLHENSSGHGAITRHGRSAFVAAGTGGPANSDVAAAMHRLLAFEQVAATSHTTQVGGGVLHHLESGSGRPLILLHGAGGGAANWYRLLRPLSAHRRVIAPDLPGFGLSDGIDAIAPLGSQVASLLLEWLDRNGVGEFDVAGTSFGGLIAFRLAQLAGDRIGALVMSDTVGLGRELPWPLRLACHPLLAPAALRPSRRGIAWQFHHLMTRDRSSLPAPQLEALLDYLFQSAASPSASRLPRAFMLFGGLAGQREVISDGELRALQPRLLLLWGEHDTFVPRGHGERAAALVRGARLRIIPGAGHSPNWEAPAAVLAALEEFLEAQTNGPSS